MKIRTLSLKLLLGMSSIIFCQTGNASDAHSLSLPDMAAIDDVKEKKDTFFRFLDPIAENVNQRIASERTWLTVMQARLRAGQGATSWQLNLMTELGRYYKVDADIGSAAYFQNMFARVDTIPGSLVLAQAANESAWGTSRFAVEGNNLFGQWCFTLGCGLVPAGRDSDASHEVQVFSSVAASVEGYFRNINTHSQYRDLRAIRSELRSIDIPLDSLSLAWGLEGYSIRGQQYIEELIDMIQFNRLQNYDKSTTYADGGIQVFLD